MTAGRRKKKDATFGPLARRFLENIRSPSERADVKRNVLKYVALNKEIKTVALEHLFAANLGRNIFPEIATKFVFESNPNALVSSLAFSPFSGSLFLRSSYRGELQIYSLFSAKPIIELTADSMKIKDAKWSPIRPTVVAVLTQNELLFYDLLEEESNVPAHRLTVATDLDVELKTLCWSTKGDIVYIADNRGTLYVHRLALKLTRYQPRGLQLIRKWVHLHDQ